MIFEKAPSRARRRVKHGDTIISTVRTYLKAVATVQNPPSNLVVSTGFAVLRPLAEIDAGYLGYFSKSEKFVSEVVANSTGVSYPATNSTDILRLSISYPPLDEQRSIAAFLDERTTHLDGLIRRKEDLLKLLAEQRATLISRAVTRGLDTAAPLRESGVPWLGQVPTHWEVKRLKFVLAGIEQGWSPQCDNYPAEEGEWGVMKVGCVNGDEFDPSENKRLPDDLEPRTNYELQIGDILVSRANTRELVGSAAIVHTLHTRLILCDKLYRLQVQPEVNNEFLIYMLRSKVARVQYEREATGTSGSMQNIGQDTILNLQFTLPPLTEQGEVVEAINKGNKRLDKMTDITHREIAKLREYRAALITAAVTGRIDVRTVMDSTPEAALTDAL
jgi:type I restriction enzyme S subunit